MAFYNYQDDSDDENVIYVDADDFSDTDSDAKGNSPSGNGSTVSLTNKVVYLNADDFPDIESNAEGNRSTGNGNAMPLIEDPEEDVNDAEISTLVTSFRGSNRGSASPPASRTLRAVIASTAGAECKAQAHGQPSNIYSRYMTPDLAEAAFQYALDKGWVRYANVDWPCAPPSQVLFDLNHSSSPEDYNTPLNAGKLFERWYVVYKGVSPGIYKSEMFNQHGVVGYPVMVVRIQTLFGHVWQHQYSDKDDLSSTASSLSLTNTDDFFGSADSRHWTPPTSEPPQIQPPQSTVCAILCLCQMSSKDSEFWFKGTDGKMSPGEFICQFIREMKEGTEQERLDNFEYYLKEGSEADEWFRVLDAGKKKKWVDLKAEFDARFLGVQRAKLSTIELERELIDMKLLDKDVGVKNPLMEAYKHVEFAN
ncbi:hypothetical protein EDD85DRAFT_950971 [Armillaria nabsnona]|nr:hypothetical protein EDD85DRAFT_950971 [Armillaria nabsnona]